MGSTPGEQASSCLPSFEPPLHPTWMQSQHIYAHHVNHGTATFETEPPDSSEIGRRWSEVTAKGLPWLVADDGGEVVGYAYAASYRPRLAYRHTVEDSIYVRADRLGTGLGRLLMPALITATQACGMRQMIAVIGDSGNQASIQLAPALRLSGCGVAERRRLQVRALARYGLHATQSFLRTGCAISRKKLAYPGPL